MGALAALVLTSQHSLQLILGAGTLSQGALLQPVSLLGDGDGGDRRPPRQLRLIGPARLPTVSTTGALDILNES